MPAVDRGDAMEKSPDAFRTISEVAEELDVPQHVLRFWETRFSQIRPMKRAGGRRYYRPNDVDLLRGIRTLLYGEGYTIKGVQKILREHGVSHVIAIGRGEIQAAVPVVDVERAVLPEEARKAVADSVSSPVEKAERPPVLGRAQVEELKLALTELGNARRLLERTLAEEEQEQA